MELDTKRLDGRSHSEKLICDLVEDVGWLEETIDTPGAYPHIKSMPQYKALRRRTPNSMKSVDAVQRY